MATMTVKKTLTSEANDLELAGQCGYLFEKLEKICPQNVPLTDEEIQEEVNMVRYGNKYGKPNRNWEEDSCECGLYAGVGLISLRKTFIMVCRVINNSIQCINKAFSSSATIVVINITFSVGIF